MDRLSRPTLTDAEREAVFALFPTPGFFADTVALIESILAARLAAVEAERDDLMALAVEDTHRRGVAEQQLVDLRASITALAETRIDGDLNGHVVPMPMVWAADLRALLDRPTTGEPT